jgi:hypothetical protein
MSTAARTLTTPRIEARQFAVQVTARAAHVATLAELANDAAGGRPSQRMTLPRTTVSSTYTTYWIPTTVPRFLRITALFTASVAGIFNGATLKLSSIDDGTASVPYSDAAIADGLKADVSYISGYSTAAPSRLGDGARVVWYLDLDTLSSTLDITAAWWRFVWNVTVTSPAELEHLTVDELPRFLVDTAETFGQIPSADYRPRGLVIDGAAGLQRLWPTIRTGHMSGLRTYHAMARRDVDAWLVTATAPATFGGSDEESAGVAALYRVRPRAMRPGVDTRVRFFLRYKLTGASSGNTATVTLTTGAGAYSVTLSDVSGSWAESAVTTAYLLAGDEDTIAWTAKVSNGASTLHIVSRVVVDDPEA